MSDFLEENSASGFLREVALVDMQLGMLPPGLVQLLEPAPADDDFISLPQKSSRQGQSNARAADR
jgi:hypothetical protein